MPREVAMAAAFPSEPGALWPRVQAQTEQALQTGALQPIETDYTWVEQDGIRFLVRIVSNLARKEAVGIELAQGQSKSGPGRNPFLPYDPDLFVADLSPTHLCLLNKFNVIDHHLLIVTRGFEAQENLLTLADFQALWICLDQIHGLGFYNAGRVAGASQPHKHLQLVPLPLTPSGPEMPIAAVLPAEFSQPEVTSLPNLPFLHGIAPLHLEERVSPSVAAIAMLECYTQLLATLDLQSRRSETGQPQTDAYNLLITRQWLLLVPRSQESFASISINALGFAGALLVRNSEQMQLLQQIGPMTVLKNVAVLADI